MTINIAALALTAVICIVIPPVILILVWKKNPMERLGISFAFGCGILIYVLMQWGIKQQGLQYLFNHTDFMTFMDNHYISYLLVVALAGAVLTLLPEMCLVVFAFKKQMSFAKASMLALGYAMSEAVGLVGYRCVYTIVMCFTTDDVKFDISTAELFLSGYERILFMVIYIAVMVALVYFVEQGMAVRGFITALLCLLLSGFLPGFFLAFTTVKYIEVFDRPVALFFSYLILTAGAAAGLVVLNALKYSLKDERVDSKQAAAAYAKKQENKLRKKQEKKAGKKLRKKSAWSVSVIEGADTKKKEK